MCTAKLISRTRWPTVVIALLFVCNSIHAGAIARVTARLPDVPPPPQAQVAWIAKSMRMNGLPMTLQSFESSQSVEATLAHYARWWSTTDASTRGITRLMRRGEWQVLALTSPRLHITVQARPAGNGSEGSIAVSRNPTSVETTTTTAFPHPRTTRVVNLQEYEDAGANAEHISLVSSRSVAIEAHEFSELLTRNGWSVYRDQDTQALARGHVLEAQKGASLAQLTLQPGAHAGSNIIVIWRKG